MKTKLTIEQLIKINQVLKKEIVLTQGLAKQKKIRKKLIKENRKLVIQSKFPEVLNAGKNIGNTGRSFGKLALVVILGIFTFFISIGIALANNN